MKRSQFKVYQAALERKLITGGLQALAKPEMVAVRPGKMSKSKFATFIGNRIRSAYPVVIDYYGHFKKSTGFDTVLNEFRKENKGAQVRMMMALVIHFAAIKVEQLAEIAPELVGEFPQFKAAVLKARGFKHE